MVEFSDFMEDMNLMELQPEGGTFTWFKGDNHGIASKIDRILTLKNEMTRFRNIKQVLLQRLE